MTDEVHPSVKELAIKTLACFPGLPVAGLDMLCEDPTKELSNDNYVIIEINSNPGLAMHTYPTKGKSRDVAQLLLEVMFPDWNLN
jgi:cyanophycin synthetase